MSPSANAIYSTAIPLLSTEPRTLYSDLARMTEDPSAQLSRAPLQEQLHHNTRKEHAALNKAITQRLPLCLPPHTSTPYSYGAGMTVFNQIYVALETSWKTLVQEPEKYSLDKRQHNLLVALQTPYIARAECLETDLHALRNILEIPSLSGYDRLHSQSLHFRDAISASILSKPHLVMAYAWPMYLALFNGGRWIANQLIAAGPDLWPEDSKSNITPEDFLSFWYFDDSARDGHHAQNVKLDFKQRFNTAAEVLTDEERDEVIQETKHVFQICADMVDLLDQHGLEMAGYQDKHGGQDTVNNRVGSTEPLTPFGSITSLKVAWQSLRSIIGYATAPRALRNEFEQPA